MARRYEKIREEIDGEKFGKKTAGQYLRRQAALSGLEILLYKKICKDPVFHLYILDSHVVGGTRQKQKAVSVKKVTHAFPRSPFVP